MATEARDFGRLEFAGGRFEEAGMPVAGLLELRRFEVLIEEVARELYKRDHMKRDRAPRGFRSSFDLRVTNFEPGCVEAVLVRPPLSSSELSIEIDDYFDRSANLVFDEIEKFANEGRFSSRLPRIAQSRLALLGRGLRDSESIGYAKSGTRKFARLDAEARRLLSSYISDIPESEEMLLTGQITGLDSKPHHVSVFLLEERRRLGGTFSDASMWEALHELSGYQTRAPLVNLSARVKISTAGELDSIEDVYNVEPALPAELAKQIESVSKLQDGWLDGEGRAISTEVIDCAERIAETIGVSKYSAVTIFPREDGGVQFEWSDDEHEIEVRPENRVIAYALSEERDNDGEKSFTWNDSPNRILKWLFEGNDD